jgi:hypothetical protein
MLKNGSLSFETVLRVGLLGTAAHVVSPVGGAVVTGSPVGGTTTLVIIVVGGVTTVVGGITTGGVVATGGAVPGMHWEYQSFDLVQTAPETQVVWPE